MAYNSRVIRILWLLWQMAVRGARRDVRRVLTTGRGPIHEPIPRVIGSHGDFILTVNESVSMSSIAESHGLVIIADFPEHIEWGIRDTLPLLESFRRPWNPLPTYFFNINPVGSRDPWPDYSDLTPCHPRNPVPDPDDLPDAPGFARAA